MFLSLFLSLAFYSAKLWLPNRDSSFSHYCQQLNFPRSDEIIDFSLLLPFQSFLDDDEKSISGQIVKIIWIKNQANYFLNTILNFFSNKFLNKLSRNSINFRENFFFLLWKFSTWPAFENESDVSHGEEWNEEIFHWTANGFRFLRTLRKTSKQVEVGMTEHAL